MDVSLMQVVRKALKNLPLERTETAVFESWRETGGRGGIFEAGDPPDTSKIVFSAVRAVTDPDGLADLFDKLYTPLFHRTGQGDSCPCLWLLKDRVHDSGGHLTCSADADVQFKSAVRQGKALCEAGR